MSRNLATNDVYIVTQIKIYDHIKDCKDVDKLQAKLMQGRIQGLHGERDP